uniref:Retrovirus-related Pol polyprotein from transposon opus n=1 Tax=Tanacetum cinerariifolium TaxID=118510 RepID=A0A699GQH8_TANCI|nr:retrovirus-related Pol polyprotein from transposon opus [Tanacetum cinerariifolium]
MIQQVQNSCQFYGLSGDDANKHLDKFLHVTQSIKVNGVTDDALRLYLFPHSLTHHATAWFDRFPRNTINTFEQMAKMFLGKYFPPTMVTKLINEIINFRQRPDESLFKAWERYKLSIDRCPNHNMLPVTQIDTFYNGLTLRHRDTINDAAATVGKTQNVYAAGAYQGGNSYQPQGNRNLLSYRSDNYLGLPGFNQNQNLNNQNQNFQNQNLNQGNNHGIPQGNNQGRNQFFQGASHGPNPPPAYQVLGYQASVHQPPIPQPRVVTTTEFMNYMKTNDAILKNMQTNMTSLTNSNLELKNMFGQFMKMNIASSLGLGTLPSNTVTNPKEDLKGITTRSGTANKGSTIRTTSSSSLPQVVERETEVTKDTVPPTNIESTKDIQPLVVQVETLVPNSEIVVAPIIEPVVAPISAPKPNQKPSIPYPSRFHTQKLRDKANDQKEKIFQIFKDLDFNISFADALILMPKFGSTIKIVDFDADPRVPLILRRSILKTERALIDVYARELTLRVNNEAVTFNLDQTSRYSANYNDMTANRIDVIYMAYDATLPEVDHSYYDTKRDILLLEAFLNDDSSLPPPNQEMYLPQIQKELKICEAKNDKSSIDEPPEVELKDLPPHLEYAFFEGDDKLPGIDPKFCTHKILMKDDFEPAVQHQRSVYLKIHKDGFTVVENEENELIPTRLVTGWRVCIDYQVFMDDFLVFGNLFETCISHLDKMLKRCEDTNLCLNWKKSHFMVKEGIILGHKISKNGIEVDKAKVDVIAKLPHRTTVKGIRCFLGHAGFYRRFIQDFSKIARLMTRLFKKDTPFFFSKECVEAFQTLKRKLTKVPILITPDWDLPFELMYDASDFAIVVVLGK